MSTLDLMPQNICENCLQAVIDACRLKEKCIDSGKIWRNRYQIKEEPESEIPLAAKLEGSPEKYILEAYKPDYDSEATIAAAILDKEADTEWNHLEIKSENESIDDILCKPAAVQRTVKRPSSTCYICNTDFAMTNKRREHTRTAHPESRLCNICNFVTKSALELNIHLMLHKHPEIGLMCEKCSQVNYVPFSKELVQKYLNYLLLIGFQIQI